NDATFLSGLDVLAEAGGADRALVKEGKVTADTSGEVTVTFLPIAGHDSAMLSGLELLEDSADSTAPGVDPGSGGGDGGGSGPGVALGGSLDFEDAQAYPATLPAPKPRERPQSGFVLHPDDDLQAAVDAYPEGTVFLLEAGTWHAQSVIPKPGD